MVHRLLEATGFDVKKHPTNNPLPQLQILLNQLNNEMAGNGAVPVILVEIERTADHDLVDTVCRLLNELSAECRGFMVLAEALTVMTLSQPQS